MNPIHTLINDTLALDEKANTSTGMLFFRDAAPKPAHTGMRTASKTNQRHMTTNPQPTPPSGDEILTPEVAKMKPEGMKCYNSQWTEPKWVLWDRPFAPEGVALTDFTFSAPLGTSALLLTPGPEAGECNCEGWQEAHNAGMVLASAKHEETCPQHPRNAYVKVLPGWLAGLPEKPEGLMWTSAIMEWEWQKDADNWEKIKTHHLTKHYAYAVPRHVFDALNRPDPIHDEVAKMEESKLQGEQGIAPLPCPFCGSPAEGGGRYTACGNAQCQMSLRPLLTVIWNTRTPSPVDGSGPTAEEMLTWLDKHFELEGWITSQGVQAKFRQLVFTADGDPTLRAAIAQAMQSE